MWKLLLALVVAPVALPVGFVVVLAALLPLAAWGAAALSYYWVRLKLTGTPIPAIRPTDPQGNS